MSATSIASLLAATAAADDVAVGRLPLLARAVAERRHAPGGDAGGRPACGAPRRRRAGGRPGSSPRRASAGARRCGASARPCPARRARAPALPSTPIVARQSTSTIRISPEGSRSVAYVPSFATSWIAVPAERPSWPPRPGVSSTLWTVVPVGMLASGRQLPGAMSARRAGRHRVADADPRRREDVALLAVRVVEQRDVRRAVRVVLDRGDLRRDRRPCVRLKSILRYLRLAPPPRWREVTRPWAFRPPDLREPLGQRLLGLVPFVTASCWR